MASVQVAEARALLLAAAKPLCGTEVGAKLSSSVVLCPTAEFLARTRSTWHTLPEFEGSTAAFIYFDIEDRRGNQYVSIAFGDGLRCITFSQEELVDLPNNTSF